MSGCSWRPHLKLETKEDDQHCYIVVLILLQQLFYQRKLQLCQVFQVINLWEITKSSLKKKDNLTISISWLYASICSTAE